MNPFDLPGPEFLGLYAVLFVAAVTVAVFLRWYLRLPSDELPRDGIELTAYEVAYLAGGDVLAVNAAMARLVREKSVTVDVANRKLVHDEELPADASPLEREIYAASWGSGETIANVRPRAAGALAAIRAKLQELELLVPEDKSLTARLIPLFVVLSVVMLGIIKIFVGVSRGKPVTFLVMFCIVSAIVAFAGFVRPVHRSRRGDRALDLLKDENAALAYTGSRRAEDLTSADLVLSVGLFGLGVLAGSELAELQTALKPPANSTGCGGGCGGGGCGGCGGGGCGGCGG